MRSFSVVLFGSIVLVQLAACKDPGKSSEYAWNPPNASVTPRLARFYEMEGLIESKYGEGDHAAVEELVAEYLELAAEYRGNWNYGNAIHDGNRFLGLVSLQRGDADNAASYLLKAGASPGSPQLNAFGPELDLANELLKQGRREEVETYLRSIKSFWENGHERIDGWLGSIEAGESPELDHSQV